MLHYTGVLLSALALLGWLFKITKSRSKSDLDSIRAVPGHRIWGSYLNMNQVASEATYRTFGLTFIFHGFLKCRKLYTSDLAAATYILSHDKEFDRPLAEGIDLKGLLGSGLIIAHGEAHKRQVGLLEDTAVPDV